MKTLIFNGSPRINGDTQSLISIIIQNIKDEYKIVNAYRCTISPCLDCRYCWKNRGCAIDDEMQEVYSYIQKCDNILIASPIYFSELTGKLLDVGSRLQTYFCAKFFRKEIAIPRSKKGAVILVGGGDGYMNKAYETAQTLLHHMNLLYSKILLKKKIKIPQQSNKLIMNKGYSYVYYNNFGNILN